MTETAAEYRVGRLTIPATLFIVELCLFLAQLVSIFIVAVLVSDLLENQARLVEFVTTKLEANSVKDMVLTFFALTTVMGVVAIANHVAQGRTVAKVAKALLDEFPRTIYFFGANYSAICLVAGVASVMHPRPDASAQTVGFFLYAFGGLLFFGYGFALKLLFVRKRQSQESAAAAAER